MSSKKTFISLAIITVLVVFVNSFLLANQNINQTIIAKDNSESNKQEFIERNQKLTDNFINKVSEICQSHSNNSNKLSYELAKHMSSTGKCQKLIGYLAKDKIKHTNSAENYLREHIDPEMNKNLTELTNNLSQEYNQYINSVCNNVNDYVNSKNSIEITEPDFLSNVLQYSANDTKNDFKAQLKLVSIDSAKTIIANYSNKELVKDACRIAYSIFGSSLKYFTLTFADGVLPIMDCIAAYKVCKKIKKGKNNFRNNLCYSINNVLQSNISEINQSFENSAIYINSYFQEYINSLN